MGHIDEMTDLVGSVFIGHQAENNYLFSLAFFVSKYPKTTKYITVEVKDNKL